MNILQRVLLAFALMTMGSAPSFAEEPADTIYHGGDILTMNDAAPTAAALAVKDGRILAVGEKSDVLKHKGDRTRLVDLAGKTLLPGFFDPHSHVYGVGLQALTANLLPAPDGKGASIADLQRILREYAKKNADTVKQMKGWIVGFGYDDAQLKERRHPTREELDAVSKDQPVYIIHQSGHLGVGNSKALALSGIAAATPDPKGGVIRRKAGSQEPNGVLEETPHLQIAFKLLDQGEAFNERMFLAGAEMYARYGYTTAQEARATTSQVKVMATVADQGRLAIDVIAYPDVLAFKDAIAAPWLSKTYRNRFRVGGAKLTIDGSPQGKTAWRDRPYYTPPEGGEASYAGYPAASEEQVMKAVDESFANGWQILTHANGEAASDLLIKAIREATAKHGKADRRPVLIHGQFLREDQVDACRELDVLLSLFPMHTFYWGDWHRDVTRGPEMADDISPTGWVMKRGMQFTTHHDAPVALPDSIRVLDATVTRRSRSGDIIGPRHRVPVMTALKAMTIWPAYQHFEEATKGSLERGKLADLVVLSANPAKIDPETLDQIHIVETIKEGETVYAKK